MATFSFKSAEILAGIYILARGGIFFQIEKNGKNLKEDFMKKGREKGGKRKKEK